MQKSEQFPKALNSLRSYRMLENFRAVFSSLPSRLRGSGSRKQIDYSYLEAFCAGEVYPETDPVEWFCYHKQFNILRSSPLARTNDKRHLASQVSPHILTSHVSRLIRLFSRLPDPDRTGFVSRANKFPPLSSRTFSPATDVGRI